jgi:tetratricopeptide (TPR) repeat protein
MILARKQPGDSGVLGVVSTSPSPSPSTSTTAPATPATPSATPSTTPSPTPTPTAESSAGREAAAAYAAGNYSGAITLYATAITETKTNQERARLLFGQGNSYRENKQTEKALTAYAKAVAADARLVVAYQAHANLLIALSRKPEAKTVLEAALAANPDNQDLKRDLSVLQLSGVEE